MRDKKKSESEKTPEQEALEKHVDAMMDPKQPDEPAVPAPKPAAAKAEPKIAAVAVPVADPPKAATTAPQLSPKLRKQISITDAAAEPLQIDKLDELTEQIAESEKKAPTKPKKPAKKTEKPALEPEEPEAPEEAAEPEEAAPEPDDISDETELDDARTDEAVDDIMAYESDVMLAVADSTAEAHSKEASAATKPKGHPVISTLFWTFIVLVVILIIGFCVLLVMGDNLANKLGL